MRRVRLLVALACVGVGVLGCGRGGRVVAPEAAPSDWCKRVAGGPSGKGGSAAVLELSAAHAGIRFFGVEENPWVADTALARALAQPPGEIDVEAALPVYVQGLRGACVVAADDRELGPARVERVGRGGKVALVRPGTGDGPVALPAGTEAVVIDLRELPAAPGLRDALERAVAPALAEPVARPARTLRLRTGMDDEVFAPGENVYKNVTQARWQEPIQATGEGDLPIVLLTGVTMAPEAAAFAGTLRVRSRAWIYGEDVLAAVAESRWNGIGGLGVVWRSFDNLTTGSNRWPDVIPADRRLTPERLAAAVARLDPANLVRPAPISSFAEDSRPRVEEIPAVRSSSTAELGLGELRAALLIAHGALRLWYPYFHVVGDSIDERLLEVLASAARLPAEPDRAEAMRALRRLGAAIDDGHNWVWDVRLREHSPNFGYLALVLDHVGSEPVVVRSAEPGINPGDALVAIDGRRVADFYAEELPRTSAATPGHRRWLASGRLLPFEGNIDVTVRAPSGVERTIAVGAAQDPERYESLGRAPSLRAAGFVDALGAADIYYLNLDREIITTDAGWLAALTEAEQQAASGLVVDMRGYPSRKIDKGQVASRLIDRPFESPSWLQWMRMGPASEELLILERRYSLQPKSAPSYRGPIVLLIGPGTVSAAENFSMMLVGVERVVVVGRTSAGTNGNITGVQLPGGFTFTFTGMEVRFPNGCRFHGVGIVPDVVVEPTAADLAAGRDVELEEAIRVLRSGRKPESRGCN